MKFKNDKPATQLPKPDSIKIVSFMPILVPGSVGNVMQMVWGLGEDNNMYQWDSVKRVWVMG